MGINATYNFSDKIDGEIGGMWQYTEYLGNWSSEYSDVDVYSIPVSLLYRITPKISAGLTYQYRYTEFSGGNPLNVLYGGDARNDHFGGVTVRGELLPKLSAMVYAGVTYRDPSGSILVDDQDDTTPDAKSAPTTTSPNLFVRRPASRMSTATTPPTTDTTATTTLTSAA